MPRSRNRQATDDLIRIQLSMFRGLGDQINLTEDDRRRALNLDDRSWRAWVNFMVDGPLPCEPPPPEMLRRLGETAFTLSVVAERVGDQADRQARTSGLCPR